MFFYSPVPIVFMLECCTSCGTQNSPVKTITAGNGQIYFYENFMPPSQPVVGAGIAVFTS